MSRSNTNQVQNTRRSNTNQVNQAQVVPEYLKKQTSDHLPQHFKVQINYPPSEPNQLAAGRATEGKCQINITTWNILKKCESTGAIPANNPWNYNEPDDVFLQRVKIQSEQLKNFSEESDIICLQEVGQQEAKFFLGQLNTDRNDNKKFELITPPQNNGKAKANAIFYNSEKFTKLSNADIKSLKKDDITFGLTTVFQDKKQKKFFVIDNVHAPFHNISVDRNSKQYCDTVDLVDKLIREQSEYTSVPIISVGDFNTDSKEFLGKKIGTISSGNATNFDAIDSKSRGMQAKMITENKSFDMAHIFLPESCNADVDLEANFFVNESLNVHNKKLTYKIDKNREVRRNDIEFIVLTLNSIEPTLNKVRQIVNNDNLTLLEARGIKNSFTESETEKIERFERILELTPANRNDRAISIFSKNIFDNQEYNQNIVGSGLVQEVSDFLKNLQRAKDKKTIDEATADKIYQEKLDLLKNLIFCVNSYGCGGGVTKECYKNFIEELQKLINSQESKVSLDKISKRREPYLKLSLKDSGNTEHQFIKINKKLFKASDAKQGSLLEEVSKENLNNQFSIKKETAFTPLKKADWKFVGNKDNSNKLERIIEKLKDSDHSSESHKSQSPFSNLDNSEKALLLIIHGAFFGIPDASNNAIVEFNRKIFDEFSAKEWMELLCFLKDGEIDSIKNEKLKLAMQTCNVENLKKIETIEGSDKSIAHLFFQDSDHSLYKEDLALKLEVNDKTNLTQDQKKDILNGKKYCLFSINGGHDFGLVFDCKRDNADDGKIKIYIQDSTESKKTDDPDYVKAIKKILPEDAKYEIIKTCKQKTENEKTFFGGLQSQCRYTAITFSEQVLDDLKDSSKKNQISENYIEYDQAKFESKFASWFDKKFGKNLGLSDDGPRKPNISPKIKKEKITSFKDFKSEFDPTGHHKIKGKSIEHWWYEKFTKVTFDASESDDKKILSNSDIFMANFNNCIFENVDFTEVKNFRNAGFFKCEFKNCTFSDAQKNFLSSALGKEGDLEDFKINISPSPKTSVTKARVKNLINSQQNQITS